MALLDALKKIPQRIGKNLERNIGGLLGESLDNLSEDERRAMKRRAARNRARLMENSLSE